MRDKDEIRGMLAYLQKLSIEHRMENGFPHAGYECGAGTLEWVLGRKDFSF